MLVAVVVLFTVCWSPYLIDNVLMSFELLPAARTGPVKHMRIALYVLLIHSQTSNSFSIKMFSMLTSLSISSLFFTGTSQPSAVLHQQLLQSFSIRIYVQKFPESIHCGSAAWQCKWPYQLLLLSWLIKQVNLHEFDESYSQKNVIPPIAGLPIESSTSL